MTKSSHLHLHEETNSQCQSSELAYFQRSTKSPRNEQTYKQVLLEGIREHNYLIHPTLSDSSDFLAYTGPMLWRTSHRTGPASLASYVCLARRTPLTWPRVLRTTRPRRRTKVIGATPFGSAVTMEFDKHKQCEDGAACVRHAAYPAASSQVPEAEIHLEIGK